MEMIPGTSREEEIYQQPILSLGSTCVPQSIKKRTVTNKWSPTLLQELLLKKDAQEKCSAGERWDKAVQNPAAVTTQGP